MSAVLRSLLFKYNEIPLFSFQHTEWKDVEYVVSDEKFEGYLNGEQATKWSLGKKECQFSMHFDW